MFHNVKSSEEEDNRKTKQKLAGDNGKWQKNYKQKKQLRNK